MRTSLLAGALLAIIFTNAETAGATSCGFSGGAVEIEATPPTLITPELDVIEGGRIALSATLDAAVPCGAATTANTRVVRMERASSDLGPIHFAVGLDPPFAPGTPVEPRSSEIEFDLDFGRHPRDRLILFGGSRNHLQLAGGSPGRVNLNASRERRNPDADMVLRRLERVELQLERSSRRNRIETGISRPLRIGPPLAVRMSIRLGSGDDLVEAGTDNDFVNAGSGDDAVRAGPGRDKLTGDRGSDALWGGPGQDQLDGLDNKNLPSLQGPDGGDLLRGGTGADLVRGDRGHDRLFGGRGRDRVLGGFGADLLVGGPGRDFLRGGPDGGDVCKGGGGRDRFAGCELIIP